MTPETRRRKISEEPEEEVPAQQQPTNEAIPEQEVPQAETNTKRRIIKDEPAEESQDKEEPGYLELFGKGLQKSAAGELAGAVEKIPPQELEEHPEGFWNSVIEESGTLVGDAPFMAIGATVGATTGTALGGPIGGVVGGGFGAMAAPAFFKEASRQYRDFQEQGGDLTFGEFLERADQVADKTLREGAFGVILGATKQSINLLRKVPAFDQLLNTKYIGAGAKAATEIGAEVGVATGIPAAAEGRLPTAEDAARAAVLFTGGRLAHLPGQLPDLIKGKADPKFKYALADRVEAMNLAYPALQEFKVGENPVYKNSIELDRNLTQFDKSVIGNVVSRINSLSPTEFPSADAAGRQMKETLSPLTAVEIPERVPGEPEPIKPVEREVPLVENPLQQAMTTISNNAASSKADLGRRIQHQYHVGREAEQAPLNDRYNEQRREVAGIYIVDNALPGEIQEFSDRFEPGAIPGSAAEKIVRSAQQIHDTMVQYDADGNIAGFVEVPLQRLISINRSLKQIPNWDVPPEMLDNLNTLTRQVDEAIMNHLEQQNPDLAQEYGDLNADYARFKNRWDNRDMRIFHDRTENSESIAKRFMNLDEFTQLQQALETTPYGNQVLNFVRREVWRDRLGRDAVNARTEGAFEAATRDLTMRDLRDMNEFLTPEQREMTQTAMQHSNQIRTSAIRSAEQFSQEKERYDSEMKEWKRKETSRKEKEKKLREEVQTKQDLLVSLLKEDPAKLVGNMESIEGIKRVKEATRKVTDGDKLYDSLARYETERMFEFMKEGYLRTGRVPYTQMKMQLHNKEFRAKLKELNGEKFVKEMDELVELTDSLSKNFKEKVVEYKDDPTTFNTVLQIYSMLGLAQGNIMTPLMAFTAKKTMLRMGGKYYNMWSNKKNYTQENIKKYVDAAKAVKKGNKTEIRKRGSLLNPPYQSP